MEAHAFELARLLSLAALIAATTEYVEVMKQRVGRRADARERAVLRHWGLRGMARVLLDARSPEATIPTADLT